jgi:RNA polymerase sigma factor (sigma-70 family)
MELAQLIKECKGGSITAQKYLYDRYAQPMFLVCRRYLRNDATAEEVLMNGFLQFFQQLHRFQFSGEAATHAWIKKIMVNECLMQLRRQHSFLQVATDDLPEGSTGTDPLEKMEAAEIYRLITQLPLGYRTVFNLYAIEQYTHAEIAKLLGISEGTSKSQVHKARQLLQQMIRQQNEYYVREQVK